MEEYRKKKDLTQRELADLIRQPGGKVGVDHSYISDAERGKRIPAWLALEIARVLGVSARKMFKLHTKKEYWVAKKATKEDK